MNREVECTAPVLIAGAGPAGLTAAIALAREGVETLVVDRKRDLSDLPRATVISTRTMEMLRSWGLEEPIRDGGIEVEWKMWSCESLALASELRTAGLRVDLYPEADKIGKQFKYGSARTVPFVAILGDDERGRGEVAMKDLRSGDQTSVSRAEAASYVKSRLDG